MFGLKRQKDRSNIKALPAPVIPQTAEDIYGLSVISTDKFKDPRSIENGTVPIFQEFKRNSRSLADPTERTVAVHWWKPDLFQAFEYVDEFSLLSLVIPKDSEDIDLQTQRVALGTKQHKLWQNAVKNSAFPEDDTQFGRVSIMWTRADRMVRETVYQKTASCYGQIPKFDQVSSLIDSALLGSKLDFHITHTPGNQLTKTMIHHLNWGENNGHSKKDDVYRIGERKWGIWIAAVKTNQLWRLTRRPVDLLAYVCKENKGSETPDDVAIGKKRDCYVTLYIRVEDSDDTPLSSFGKELRSIAPKNIRLDGMNLVEAFKIFVPGSPPPKNHHFMQKSLGENEWRSYLDELVKNNSNAHALTDSASNEEKRVIYMGKQAHVKVNELSNGNTEMQLLNHDGPSVFLDTSILTSMGIIEVSGEGKTTYELFLFLQRFGPFAMMINLAPGVNEAAESLFRSFDPDEPDKHIHYLSFDAEKDKEAAVRKSAKQFAESILEEIRLTGRMSVSPLYITPTNRSALAHTWEAEFIKTFREGWKQLSKIGDEQADVAPGVVAGKELGIGIDNISAARQHSELLLELEDLANNGKNENIRSDHLSHTEDGLPKSYVDALAYRLRAWKIGNYFIYRLYKPDGTPLTPFINGTLPPYLWEWFARRTNVAARNSHK